MLPDTKIQTQTQHQPTKVTSANPNQYFDREARFFDTFNNWTGRLELYHGFIAAYSSIADNGHKKSRFRADKVNNGKIAVDFGCGTGGLTSLLPRLGFTKVYGIDPSEAMLRMARNKVMFNAASADLITDKRLEFMDMIPLDAMGSSSLVTAVHVQYHFGIFKDLRDKYFGTIASLLANNGQAIVIASPEQSIRASQDYTLACIHKDDVPPKVLTEYLSDPKSDEEREHLLQMNDGYIPVRDLPLFEVKNGTQLKITFSLNDPLPPQHISLHDTFWRDATVEKAASEAGLKRIFANNLEWRGHNNSYKVTVYKKKGERKNRLKKPSPILALA